MVVAVRAECIDGAEYGALPADATFAVALERGLSPIGQLVFTELAARNLSQADLARMTGLQRKSVYELLYAPPRRRSPMSGGKPVGPVQVRPAVIPRDSTLVRVADALGISLADARRAAKEMREQRPKQELRNKGARVRRRAGRMGLRKMGDQLQQRLRDLPRDRLEEIRAAGLEVAHRWWETATERERLLRSLAMLDPRPAGTFGLCRVCGKLTYLAPGFIRTSAILRAEYHANCQAQWHRSAAWSQWATTLQKARWGTGPTAKPQPQLPYGRGRRLNSDEIASYYAATIEYLQVSYRTAKGRLAPARRRGVTSARAETVADVASKYDIDTHGLLKRVEWVRDHLPPVGSCNTLLAKKIRVLQAWSDGRLASARI